MQNHDLPLTLAVTAAAGVAAYFQWAVAAYLAAGSLVLTTAGLARLYVEWPDLKAKVRSRRRSPTSSPGKSPDN